ncbi:hypothetical protein Pmar_PMAR026044 [Perkinsus marinus ATCC 50983]|uniref:Uncharacterized protein n=1 Tax=Perkinsus marinus (strain ATCC 50983 / TXsc) TaxID=423536 RepID=C5LK98_PERM5|nr:hypothetical protein Pmar_PMAR026044 [Perkinsus marinus ATCC 50983]EER02885.1 hypothetical protein Pmar_PMAR026044 [Perkinsus marinus ATCC 50983]|eukprot:XP_002771069.1 hypothetical protein Pmar_PMAR026044 [Perkinsus marinus ATCC 50983]
MSSPVVAEASYPQIRALSLNQRLVSNCELEAAVKACDKLHGSIPIDEPLPLKDKWVLWEQLTLHKNAATPEPKSEDAEGDGDASKQQQQVDLTEVAVAAARGISNFGELTNRVAEISTVQDFWKYYNFLPQPSAVIGDNLRIVRYDMLENGEMSKTPTHSLGALMLFLDGVKPEWEDPANAKGGHFQFTMQAAAFKSKASFDFEASNPVTQVNAGLALMDEIWNNLVLAVVGNTLEPKDFVTGLRLVDKVKRGNVRGGSSRSNASGHLRAEVWFRDIDKDKVRRLRESMEMVMRQRLDQNAVVDFSSDAPPIFPGYRLDLRPHDDTAMQQNVQDSINTRKQYKRTKTRKQIMNSARSRGEFN